MISTTSRLIDLRREYVAAKRTVTSLFRLLHARDGVTAIEFAFIAPLLILMFLGIVEFGRLIWTQASLQAAVETTARCLAVGTCSNAQTSVDNQLASYGLSVQPNVTTASSCTSSEAGSSVSATLTFTFVAPAIFPWTPTLSALSCYPSQS